MPQILSSLSVFLPFILKKKSFNSVLLNFPSFAEAQLLYFAIPIHVWGLYKRSGILTSASSDFHMWFRWAWAVRKIILRRRSRTSSSAMENRFFLRSAAVPFTSFVGLKTTGPQLAACCYLPPAEKYPGHPDYKPAPPAQLDIQVYTPHNSNFQPCFLEQDQMLGIFCGSITVLSKVLPLSLGCMYPAMVEYQDHLPNFFEESQSMYKVTLNLDKWQNTLRLSFSGEAYS